jgi:hypothetical protein
MALFSTSSLQSSTQTFSINELREQLNAKAEETVCAIAADYANRMEGYKGKVSLLSSGMFYGNDYFKALKTVGQTARLQYLIEKGTIYHGMAPSSAFAMVSDPNSPTGRTMCVFNIKKGITPTAALKAFREGLTFTDCGETCQIAYLTAIQHVLGEEKFNALFASDTPTPMQISPITDQRIGSLTQLTKHVPFSEKVEKGQILYFPNVPFYLAKHLTGDAAGYFTICCSSVTGKETFTTLGLRPSGSTVQEIQQTLLEEFNADPVGVSIVTSEVALRIISKCTPQAVLESKKLAKTTLSFEEFDRAKQQEVSPIRWKFDVERIQQLVKASVSEARTLFTKWNCPRAQ